MPITFKGRETFTSNTGVWSVNATLPANTDFVVCTIHGFYTGTIINVVSITLGGTVMTFQVKDNTDSTELCSWLYTQPNTAGTRAFALTMDNNFNKAGFVILTYWQGVHTTIGVRQALANHSTIGSDQIDLTFNTLTDDVVVVQGSGKNSEPINPAVNGQTSIYADTVAFQGYFSAAGYASASHDITVVGIYGDLPCAAGVCLIPSVPPPGANVGRIWTYNEDFGESGTGYRNVGYWTETLGASCILDEDYNATTVSGAPVTWGAQCLRAFSSAGGNAQLKHDFSGDPLPSSHWRFEFILTSLPTGGTIFNLQDTALNNICSLVVTNASPTFTLTPTFDGTVRTAKTGLALNTKYSVEVIWDTVYQIWQWKLNNVLQESGTPAIAGQMAYAWLGMAGGGSSDIFFDNYWADYSDWVGAVPNTYLVAKTGVVGGATTPAIDTTNAKLLIALGLHFTTSAMTITDSKGNTWRPLTVRGNASSGYGMLAYAYDKAGAALSVGTGHTFSVTAEAKQSIIVQAWGGNNPVVDPFISETGNTATGTTVAPGAILPLTIDDLIVVFEAAPSPINETPTIDKGFIITDSYHDGTNQGGSMGYWLVTNQNPMNPTWTHATSSNYAAGMAMFKQIALDLYKVSSWAEGFPRWV